MPWCICHITNFNLNYCLHFTFHSHLLHSTKWSGKQSREKNVLKKANLILMQMPTLGQVKRIYQMPLFLGGCKGEFRLRCNYFCRSALQRSAFWCSELQHRCLKTSSPDKWMFSTFISLILICLFLQWEKHDAFALKCGYKRKSLINLCCREYSEAVAYNSSPPSYTLREYCLVIKAWACKKGKNVPTH